MNVYIKVRIDTIVAMTTNVQDAHVWAERSLASEVPTYNVYKLMVTEVKEPWFFLRSVLNACDDQIARELKFDPRYYTNN